MTSSWYSKITSALGHFLRSRLFPHKRSNHSNVEHIHAERRTALNPQKQAELEKLCNELFKKKELITSGKLQFIGLAKIKNRMGRAWAGLCQVVYDTAEDVIKKHIDKGDIFIRYKDDTYVLIFARASLKEGQAKATLIAEEIRQRLFVLKEDELKSIEIRQAVCEIMTDSLIDMTFPEMVDTMFVDRSQIGKIEAPPEPEGEGQPTIIDVEAKDYRKAGARLPETNIQDVQYSYMPLWDTQRGMLTTYLCLSGMRDKADNSFDSHASLYRGRGMPEKLALDIAILDFISKELAEMEKDGRKLYIVCPVQYETLYNFETYEAYKSRILQIPLGQRVFLKILVMNVDGKIPPKDAYWFVKPLKQFCPRIMLEVPLRRDINFNYLRECGVTIAGIRLQKNTDASEQDIIGLTNSFGTKSKFFKIEQAFILDVQTLSLTTSAVCAGFDYIGGSAIHEPVSRPDTVHRYRHEDLLSGLIQKK